MALHDRYRADLQAQFIRLAAEFGCAGPMVMVMTFAGRVDETRLTRAARLMLDAEPILGCRFDMAERHPTWRRRDDIDRMPWCHVDTTDDADEFIRQLLIPRPEHLEQTFLLHLLHRRDGDTVLMWISHLLADSYAANECAVRLAAIYTRLGHEPDYRPELNPAPRENEVWMRAITVRGLLRITWRDIVDAFQGRGPVHGFRRDYRTFRAMPPSDAAIVKYQIPPPLVRAIDSAAAARRCWRNDILTTAFLRTFAEFAGQGATAKAQVGLTVNLRRYVPSRYRGTICSMVGLSRVSVGPALGMTFDETLARVTAIVTRQKKALIGAANPLYVRLLAMMSFRRKRVLVERMLRKAMRRPMAPTFSNAGRLSPTRLQFDGVPPVDVGFAVFPVALPLFLVSAVEYRGAVTLTCCFQPGDLSREQVYHLLERMARECPVDAPAEPAAAAA